MSAADIGLLFAQLVSAWVFGFSCGFVLTRTKEAINAIT